ncbi:MAG: GspH/FimT family pseudopilin [Spongiibacteraceae bacterium]|nr:GspH/FimT family pseudopilin [Spongiibacteraceae bacterium]
MKYHHGWTLIELLVTLSIISLLIGFGIPTLNQSLQRSTEKIAFTMLQRLSYYARTKAIRHNNYFTLCPSNDQVHCGGTWNQALIIFSDQNKNEIVDGSDELFRTFTFGPNTPCIRWNRKRRQYLQFKPSGASNGTAGHFAFCDPVNTTVENKVVVSFNGRTSLKSL